MDKTQARKGKRGYRTLIQLAWTALTNGFVYGFANRQIYQGALKRVCLPGLNCYSCPGAFGACPIGSLQAVITSYKYDFSYYMVGVLIFFGALLGRAICGFLCPFGLIQDLLHKIPFPKKRKDLPGHKLLIYLKYVVFALFVCVLPYVLVTYKTGVPAFCKYVCPSGTLMGALALVPGNPELASQAGGLFYGKLSILGAILVLSLMVYRPFCKYLCPLGAIYGLFARVSAVRLKLDAHSCVHCGACARACKMSVDPVKTPNSAECIRCGDCVRACPHAAITYDTPLCRARRAKAQNTEGETT